MHGDRYSWYAPEEEIEYPLGVLKSEAIKSKISLIFRSTLILQRVIALSSEASHRDRQVY